MGKRILIADDAAFIRMMLTKILTEAGYEIAGEAKNGAEAVKRYKELKPDLVTLDITMPEMNGLSALKAIMQFDPSAKVLMCTAMGQKSLITEAIEVGAVGFLIKPFDDIQVVEMVGKILL